MPRRVGGGSSNLGLVLLAGHIMNFGVDKIPPATLALIAGQAAIFLDMFPKIFPTAEHVCISSYVVYYHRDWPRLILGAFYHGSDMHLYYNMLSLLYKGSWLEKRLGTPYFIYLISVFTALTSAVYVGLGFLFSHLLSSDSYQMQCAVGFSGVLFALKVLSTHYTPSGPQRIFGFIPVPSKHVYWAELILIQLLVPNASFIGHLAGILVGVAYIKGPLKFIMDAFFPPKGTRSQAYPTTRTNSSSSSSSSNRRAWDPNSNYNPTYTTPPSAPPYEDPPPPYNNRDMPYNNRGMPDNNRGMPDNNRDMPNNNYDSREAGIYPNLDELRSRRSQYYQ